MDVATAATAVNRRIPLSLSRLQILGWQSTRPQVNFLELLRVKVRVRVRIRLDLRTSWSKYYIENVSLPML